MNVILHGVLKSQRNRRTVMLDDSQDYTRSGKKKQAPGVACLARSVETLPPPAATTSAGSAGLRFASLLAPFGSALGGGVSLPRPRLHFLRGKKLFFAVLRFARSPDSPAPPHCSYRLRRWEQAFQPAPTAFLSVARRCVSVKTKPQKKLFSQGAYVRRLHTMPAARLREQTAKRLAQVTHHVAKGSCHSPMTPYPGRRLRGLAPQRWRQSYAPA